MRARRHLTKFALFTALAVATFSGVDAQDKAKPVTKKAEAKDRIEKIFGEIKEAAEKRKPIAAFSDQRDVYKEDELSKIVAARLPDLDLSGKHDITKIKDPGKGNGRDKYTQNMIRVIRAWLALDMGPTLNKVLELQKANLETDPVLMVLTAHFSLRYGLSTDFANRLIAAAINADDSYASALYESAYFFAMRGMATSALRSATLALKLDDNFQEARHLRASLYYKGQDAAKCEDDCVKILNSLPKDRRFLREVMALMRMVSTDRAEKIFKELLGKYQKSEMASDVLYMLARIDIEKGNDQDAIAAAKDLIKSDAAKSDPDFGYDVRRELLGFPVFTQLRKMAPKIIAASGEKKAQLEKEKASLTQQLEAVMRDIFEFDLASLSPLDRRKGESPEEFALLYSMLGRNSDALKILQEYDKRAAPLSPSKRRYIRQQITRLRTLTEGRVSVEMLEQLFDARKFGDLSRDLARYISHFEDDAGKFDFSDIKLISLLIKISKSTDRLLAGNAMELLGIGAGQSKEDQPKADALSALKARMAEDLDAKTDGQYDLLKQGCSGLRYLKDKAGTLELLRFLEERFDAKFKEFGKRLGRKDKDFKRFWEKSIVMVRSAYAGLDDDEYEVEDSVLELSGRGPKEDFEAWVAKVRKFVEGK